MTRLEKIKEELKKFNSFVAGDYENVGDEAIDDIRYLLSVIEKQEKVVEAAKAVDKHVTPIDLAWGHKSFEDLALALRELDADK